MASKSVPELIELPVGERHSLTLPGQGTAGYRWIADMADGDEVAEVRPEGAEPPATDAVGASAGERFEIHANRPGEAQVRFEQRRPWESDDEPPAAEHALRIRVI